VNEEALAHRGAALAHWGAAAPWLKKYIRRTNPLCHCYIPSIMYSLLSHLLHSFFLCLSFLFLAIHSSPPCSLLLFLAILPLPHVSRSHMPQISIIPLRFFQTLSLCLLPTPPTESRLCMRPPPPPATTRYTNNGARKEM
jgi:hypothetical protein